eukprot:4097601-Ditylum_brightwellii.AAC.1
MVSTLQARLFLLSEEGIGEMVALGAEVPAMPNLAAVEVCMFPSIVPAKLFVLIDVIVFSVLCQCM